MEKYRYSAVDESGKQVSGTESAATRSAAHLALLERGYQTIEVSEKKSVLQFEVTKKLVSRKDIMHFSRQLSVFVRAGIPIMEALQVIAEETPDKLLQRALLDMIDRIQAGDTFACQSDGKSYEVAAAAYQNAPGNTANTPATTTAELTGNAFGGPFLHQAANNPAYVVLMSGDAGAPAAAVAGHVYVGPTAATAVDYDAQGAGGCNAVT